VVFQEIYNSPMPQSIFFPRRFAIHGSYEGSASRGPASQAESGCIRTMPRDSTRWPAAGHGGDTIVVSGEMSARRGGTAAARLKIISHPATGSATARTTRNAPYQQSPYDSDRRRLYSQQQTARLFRLSGRLLNGLRVAHPAYRAAAGSPLMRA